jgi:hypothetical protein
MAFELEALVGHLYVAAGRTIKTTPPGALCEVAPRRAARGREIDTIFVLVLPSGTIAPNTFYEQMALMAAERYFSQGGSVTSALREVLNTLNHNLYEHNQSGRKHYEANMLVAVLRNEMLYTARVGAAVVTLQQNDETLTTPTELTDDDALFQPPLGVQPIPEIDMSKHEIQQGARLLLTDANIAEITRQRLHDALASADIEQVLDTFKTLVTLQIQMMAVEFVTSEQAVMVPAATGQSTAVLTAEIAASRSKAAADQAAAQAAAAEAALQQAQMNTPQNRLKRRVMDAVVMVSRSVGHFFSAIGTLSQKLFGRDPSAEGRRRNRLLMTAAVFGLPTIIISAVLFSWVFNVGQTAYEQCVADVNRYAELARTIDSSVPSNVIASWEGTLRRIDECYDLRPETDDPTLSFTAQEGRLIIDNLRGISRRDATRLYWWDGANIRAVVRQGLDIYALDSNNNLVYRLQLTEDGLGLASTPQPVANMRAGAQVDGMVLGEIIDIAFDAERNQIVALDENGVMVNCLPRFINQCESQQILGTENWLNPTRITFFGVNFYVLDNGSDQIWRYQPVGATDNYGNPPQEYFLGTLRYDLENAVDFAIGAIEPIAGKVFILYADGTVTAHFDGDPEPFVFGNFRQGLELDQVGAEAMYLSNNRVETVFFFSSRASRTLYETTAAGTFIAAYRIADESLLERLSDVTADTDTGVIYAASGNAILAIPKAE